MSRPPGLVVVSGGQTGVDRAALEVAVACGLPYAGWCPAGGWAEDLTLPPGVRALYPQLRETPAADPSQRTRWNVRDSDATLVLEPVASAGSPGTAATLREAGRLGRPLLRTVLADASGVEAALDWLEQLPRGAHGPRVNVAGPRESEAPGVGEAAAAWLRLVLARFVTLR